jgi:hypothetical protein
VANTPQLPLQQTLAQLSAKWASILNPFLGKPALQVSVLKNQTLTAGNNVINHGLGRALQGWYPVRYHGAYAQIYDNQDTNQMPTLTLVLNASAPITIDLVVF